MMRLFCTGLLVILMLLPALATARVLHQERSLYQNVLVIERFGEVCLQFTVRSDLRNQSCMKIDRPREMVFTYTRMMLGALLLRDDPGSILVVGLGGGTLTMALQDLFPEAHIDAVEIDPAVVRVAERFFQFKAGPHTKVHTQDARVFGRRMAAKRQHYDLILLDAYNGEYIPEHLLTAEYLTETKNLLAPGGILAANTFAISDLYDHESTTYTHVFGTFLNFRLSESANRVIMASNAPFVDTAFRRSRAAALGDRTKVFGVNLASFVRHLDGRQDWNPEARILTDQYSPANLLNR
jgi:spermidine synthase